MLYIRVVYKFTELSPKDCPIFIERVGNINAF